jgi:hypothetical protein
MNRKFPGTSYSNLLQLLNQHLLVLVPQVIPTDCECFQLGQSVELLTLSRAYFSTTGYPV